MSKKESARFLKDVIPKNSSDLSVLKPETETIGSITFSVINGAFWVKIRFHSEEAAFNDPLYNFRPGKSHFILR